MMITDMMLTLMMLMADMTVIDTGMTPIEVTILTGMQMIISEK